MRKDHEGREYDITSDQDIRFLYHEFSTICQTLVMKTATLSFGVKLSAGDAITVEAKALTLLSFFQAPGSPDHVTSLAR